MAPPCRELSAAGCLRKAYLFIDIYVQRVRRVINLQHPAQLHLYLNNI